jgi:hypothetical protein
MGTRGLPLVRRGASRGVRRPGRALSSAVAIQRAVGTEPWPFGLPIRVRMALH